MSRSAFEVEATSDHSGSVQLYFRSGEHFSEEDSTTQPIVAGRPALLRFALPYGIIKGLRFDPLDRDGHLTFSGARVVDAAGHVVASFSPDEFRALNQIQELKVRGNGLYVETTPGGMDPQLILGLAQPLSIARPLWVWRLVRFLAAALGCGFAIELCARSRFLRIAERARSLWARACASPGCAILAAALLGTVAANYPIIFAGKSLVTPGLVGGLLYGEPPFVPGNSSAEMGSMADANGADVGALLWYHLPVSVAESRAVFRDRELPLWNRYNSAGTSLLGQGQSCFGDPLQVLPLIAGGAAWAWDIKFLVAKWLFACGVGLCVWRQSRHLISAVALAGSSAFVGYFLFRVNHPAIFSLCYSPWILYCWIRFVEGGSLRESLLWLLALTGANWTELNSGTVKEAYVLLLTMNFSGFCIVAACRQPFARKLKLLGAGAGACAVFAMVGSPVWLTFLRELGSSYTSYAAPAVFQIQPGMFLGLFDEAFYRPFCEGLHVMDPSGNFFMLIGLAWVGVRWRSSMGNRVVLALTLSALPAAALVFGMVPAALVYKVPFLANIAHLDDSFSCTLIVLGSVVAGAGWREAWDRIGTREGRREAIVVLSLLILSVGVLLGTAQAAVKGAYWSRTWGQMVTVPPFVYAYALSLLVAAALLLLVLHSCRRRGSATPAMVILLIAAFGIIHWRMGLQAGTGFKDYVFAPVQRVDLLRSSPAMDLIKKDHGGPFRVVGFGNDFLPGWSAIYDLEGISGPDALMNPYYREFLEAAGVPRVWDWRHIIEPRKLAPLRHVLDALNVKYFVAYPTSEKPEKGVLKPVQSLDMDIYESPTAWPRAFFTDSAAVYDSLPQYCSWLGAGDGRPFAAVERGDWGAISPLPRVSGDLRTRKIVAAANYTLTTNTTSFTVDAPDPGFIVLSEAYEKGNFRVTLNGRRVPYLRVNHAFMGIYVDSPGRYAVRFEYLPRGFVDSEWAFAVGLGLIALVLIVLSRPRSARPYAPFCIAI